MEFILKVIMVIIKNDKVLSYLIPILNKIANNPQNDVRKEIKKYHEEIYTKITTNLS